MDAVIHAVNRIGHLSGAQVDRGFGQGYEVIREQFELLVGEPLSDLYIDGKYIDYHDTLTELQAWIQPYQFPDDYFFFLQFYGGLAVERDTYTLVADGIGPMCEEWYSYLCGDGRATDPNHDGLLQIGRLEFNDAARDYPEILFFLDFAGVFERGSIIGIGPWRDGDPDIAEIIGHPQQCRHIWKILAKSFTAWLEMIASTEGRLAYT